MTGKGILSVRTIRSAASTSSTRARASRRRMNGGSPDDQHGVVRPEPLVQRARGDASGRTMHRRRRGRGMTPPGSYSPSRETSEGRVYTLSGGDWDSVFGGDPSHEERLVVNM